MVPSITIFVSHAPGCKYREDETWKRCNCRKHLRWSHDSKQYRRSANTRSGSKRNAKGGKLEEGFEAGGKPTAVTHDGKTIARAVELLLLEKKTEGIKGGVLKNMSGNSLG